MPHWSHPALAKKAYDVVGWFNVQVTLNYLAAAFLLLDFKASVSAWTRCWWYAHVAIFATLGFLHFGGRRWLKSGLYSRGKPGAPGVVPSVSVSPPTPQDDLVAGRSSDVDTGKKTGLVRRRSIEIDTAAAGDAGDFGPAGVAGDLAERADERVEVLEDQARDAIRKHSIGRQPQAGDDGVEVLITEERVPEHGEGEGEENPDGEDTDLEWVRHDLESVGDQGISPDDLLRDIINEFETPTDTPRSGSPSLERQQAARHGHAKSE